MFCLSCKKVLYIYERGKTHLIELAEKNIVPFVHKFGHLFEKEVRLMATGYIALEITISLLSKDH